MQTKVVERLIEEFSKMPGIGSRTAERMADYVLRSSSQEALRLADAIRDVKTQVRHCEVCFNLSEGPTCPVCSNPDREVGLVCVVEQPKDLLAIERTGSFRGRYHVLLGRLAPLEGVSAEDLTIEALLTRVRDQAIREVILATNPTYEGDGTALYLVDRLKETGVKVTRIARGIPAGSNLEYVSKNIVTDAMEGRREV